MSLISFVPVNGEWVFTVSREEKKIVTYLSPPKLYTEANGKLLYSKDQYANGSTTILHERGTLGIIFAGSSGIMAPVYEAKEKLSNLLLEVLKSPQPAIKMALINFRLYEPFTLLLFDDNILMEFEWNGMQIQKRTLSNDYIHYWESVLTTMPEQIAIRNTRFVQMVANKNPGEIIELHQALMHEKEQLNKKLSNTGLYNNISITQVCISDTLLKMHFYNLIEPQFFTQTLLRKR